MRAIIHALGGVALLLILTAGLLGATSATIPATGLVVAPVLLWVVLRHRLVGLRLLAGALRGTLPMESWPEAREVVADAQRFGLWAGGAASAASLGVVVVSAPELIGQIGLQVILHATSPLIIAGGLAVTLWTPLDRALAAGYEAWLGALREALTPTTSPHSVRRKRTA